MERGEFERMFRAMSGKFGRFVVIAVCVILGLLFFALVIRVLTGYAVFSYLTGKLITSFGLDTGLAHLIASYLTIITMLIVIPLVLSLILGYRKKELALLATAFFVVGGLAMYFVSSSIVFNRATGEPVLCYIKTIHGFKVGGADSEGECGFDPETGEKFKLFDKASAAEYRLWLKGGGIKTSPVEEGEYFDLLTGKPIVWYALRDEKKVALFSLPGFDPLTGNPLFPITKDVAEKIVRGELTIVQDQKEVQKYAKGADEKNIPSSASIVIQRPVSQSNFYTLAPNETVFIEIGDNLSWYLHEGDSFYVQFLDERMLPIPFRLAGVVVGPEPVLQRRKELFGNFTFTGKYLRLIGPTDGKAVVEIRTR